MSIQPQQISFAHKVKLSDSVLMEDIEGEAVLLHIDSEKYFALDEVGTVNHKGFEGL